MQTPLVRWLSLILCAFTLVEVNYPRLTPISQLALFAMLGLVIAFLVVPARPAWRPHNPGRPLDWTLAGATVAVCLYVVVQTEPTFQAWWAGGRSLGNRAAFETGVDITVGIVGLLLVFEATRRTIGLALPLLSAIFLAYAYWGALMPDWLFPHRGYPVERIVAQTFLHAQGVFGVALGVMFTYVFLFVVLGALLNATRATEFIMDLATRTFRGTAGGPAKVGVLSAGLMGTLSGSAVANTAACGTFTIPMMRSAGFVPATAAGVQAAASSGGALVPPVMGAAAYMMLEIVDPPVTYLEIIRAALLPALLYYLSLFLYVHFYARRARLEQVELPEAAPAGAVPVGRIEGIIFAGALAVLMGLLALGYTPFRAVTFSLASIVVLSFLSKRTRIRWAGLEGALVKSARDALPLIAASACVGIVIGVVTLTGVGSRFPSALLPLAQESLLLALVIIMFSSIILGMGLPSTVSYLLLATLIGPVLGQLGVIPLAGHLFIFYFAMMSMVTPPVALAGFAAASIAGTPVMQTSMAAFRVALVGFTLPFIFVYRPQLLLLDPATGA
ncbi:MAG TPA: TRAP transporter fused permease subunit, partial [Thermoanaerobaculia bacterium]|nr:TRAP transporter fused permease subunit [Thermoanaerobaculia bacterium]